MLRTTKIVDVRTSWVQMFGVSITDVSVSCCKAFNKDASDTKVFPLCRIISPITPKSNCPVPLAGNMGTFGVFVGDTLGSEAKGASGEYPAPAAGGIVLLVVPANLLRYLILPPHSRPNERAFVKLVSMTSTSIKTCFNGMSKFLTSSLKRVSVS